MKLQKTGMLVLNTDPKGARIYLNNVAQESFFHQLFLGQKDFETTPTKIKNITPGEYNVRIELDNYWPWQKTLEITPGETVFAEDVKLFKKTVPILIKNLDEGNIAFSPDKKNILAFDKNIISVISSEGEISLLTLSATSSIGISSIPPVLPIIWSNNSKKIITGQLIFDIRNFNQPIKLTERLGQEAKNFKWAENDDNLIFYEEEKTIYQYRLDNFEQKTVITGDYFDYFPEDEKINLAVAAGKTFKVETADGLVIETFTVPSSAYTFSRPTGNLLQLYDEKNKILFLFDPLSPIKPLKNTINNINLISWVNTEKLLTSDGFEIWLYDIKNNSKTLLTRVSSKISSLTWHPSNNYIVFTTEKDINILELDNREKHNITKILEFELVKEAFLNENGDIIYFYGRIGNQEGLYKLNI